MTRIIKVGKKYKHFKGHIYTVIAIGYNSESYNEKDPNSSKMVVYQDINNESTCWIRPYDMFNSLVDYQKYPETTQKYRFEEINDKTT